MEKTIKNIINLAHNVVEDRRECKYTFTFKGSKGEFSIRQTPITSYFDSDDGKYKLDQTTRVELKVEGVVVFAADNHNKESEYFAAELLETLKHTAKEERKDKRQEIFDLCGF